MVHPNHRYLWVDLCQLNEDDFLSEARLVGARASFALLQQQIVKASVLRHFDSTKDVHVVVFTYDWALDSTCMQKHEGMYTQPVLWSINARELNKLPSYRARSASSASVAEDYA